MSDEHEKVIKEVVKYQGPVFDVVTKTISTDHGTITRDVCVHHGDSVAIAVFYQEGLVLISKEYRVGDQKETWGLPAGMMKEGETPVEAGSRELEEETGLKVSPGKFIDLGVISSSSGFVQEKVHVVSVDLGDHSLKWYAPNWDKDEFINDYNWIDYRETLDNFDNFDDEYGIYDSRFYLACAYRLNNDLADVEDELEEWEEWEQEDEEREQEEEGCLQMDEQYTTEENK